jgi:GWxTD domain-containing protein
VFLSNTGYGAATDSLGRFEIRSVPVGRYELVASMMGYEAQTRRIDLVNNRQRIFQFRLEPIVLPGETVRISAPDPWLWRWRLRTFRSVFLGHHQYARACELVNPEVLDFQVDEATGEFTATSQGPLSIENRMLGYRIIYVLKDFSYKKGASAFRFSGHAYFQELEPEDEKQQTEWAGNRRRAYEGSMRHFFATLISGRLDKEGFEVHQAAEIPGDVEAVRIWGWNWKKAVKPGPKPWEREIFLPENIKVVYTREAEEESFIRLYRTAFRTIRGRAVVKEFAKGTQESWLAVKLRPLLADTLGHILDPYGVTVYGYWAWEETAGLLLPWDFQPEREIGPGAGRERVPEIAEAISPRTYAAADTLHLARLLAEDGIVYRTTRLFYEGLEHLSDPVFADSLYEDVLDILSLEELNAYPKAPHRGRYLLNAWQKRDPTPATLENERLVEHYQRLAFARRRYSSFQPRGYDDRGMIYVRYGPPDNSLEIPSHRHLYPSESWVYTRMGGEITYDFICHGGLYVLTDLLTQERISGLGITDIKKKDTRWIVDFVEPRQSLALKYNKMFLFYSTGAVGYDVDQYYVQNMRDKSFLPHARSDYIRPEAALEAGLALCRFYRDSTARVEIYYGVPWDQLETRSLEDGRLGTELVVACAVRDTQNVLLKQAQRTVRLRLLAGTEPSGQVFINQTHEDLLPGVYRISVELNHVPGSRVLESTFDVTVPEISARHLMMSDVEKVQEVRPVKEEIPDPVFAKGDLLIYPAPFPVVSQGRPSTFYFEVYNLLIGPNGRTEYEVSYELRSNKSGLLSKLNPFGKETTALSTEFRQTGERRDEQVYFSLDFSRVEPGDYTLEITVTDQVSGETRKAEMALKLAE